MDHLERMSEVFAHPKTAGERFLKGLFRLVRETDAPPDRISGVMTTPDLSTKLVAFVTLCRDCGARVESGDLIALLEDLERSYAEPLPGDHFHSAPVSEVRKLLAGMRQLHGFRPDQPGQPPSGS